MIKDEEIIALAIEKGAATNDTRSGQEIYCLTFSTESLLAFTKAIQDKQREEDVKICEEVVTFPAGHGGQWEGYGPIKTQRGGLDCAAAIRAQSPESDIDQVTRTT